MSTTLWPRRTLSSKTRGPYLHRGTDFLSAQRFYTAGGFLVPWQSIPDVLYDPGTLIYDIIDEN